jgi:L-seryl-tRNA(Ser) seleniumtransferase
MGRGDGAAGALNDRLRALPSVERLAAALDAPGALAVAAARTAIEAERERLVALAAAAPAPAPFEALADRARALLAAGERPSLGRVVNATGVIVHTNLGRAPLAGAARDAVARAAEGYANLELDLASGSRGSRQAHVEGLVRELTGAEAALVVNNGAAAALLAVAALGGRGLPVVVSRGELVEIGGGFRIPEVVASSGARLVEVGTTNRTRLADYRAVLDAHPDAVILRVHASNFRVVGFTERVEIEELCDLGRPVVDDVGSGNLAEDLAALADEPSVRRSVHAGSALVCFSGDKLLGGPQAGLLAGTEAAVAAARRHPLARALRIDKLSLAALEATLRLYRDPARARAEIPVLAMLAAPEAELAARASALHEILRAGGVASSVERAVAKVGGGALPLLELEGPVVVVDPAPLPADELARRLRDVRELHAAPPIAVVARIERERLLLDPRTMTTDDAGVAGTRIVAALR